MFFFVCVVLRPFTEKFLSAARNEADVNCESEPKQCLGSNALSLMDVQRWLKILVCQFEQPVLIYKHIYMRAIKIPKVLSHLVHY